MIITFILSHGFQTIFRTQISLKIWNPDITKKVTSFIELGNNFYDRI